MTNRKGYATQESRSYRVRKNYVSGCCCKSAQTPGLVNPGRFGQLPNWAGSPPIRTHWECDGVGPSRIQSWCHAGGETPELGGAVIVHEVPEQVKAGNIVRAPKEFPWVLEEAAKVDHKKLHLKHKIDYNVPLVRETRRVAVVPW